MDLFHVRDNAEVESGLSWKVIDGTAYVSVGGETRSYITVDSALTCGAAEGTVLEAYAEISGDSITLRPFKCSETVHEWRALVLVPCGIYTFIAEPDQQPVRPRSFDEAEVYLLKPGAYIEGYPIVRNEDRSLVLLYDGHQLLSIKR